MTRMKKLLICILLCIMLPTLAFADAITPISCAAKGFNADNFSHYAAYSQDQNTGLWKVHGLTADALLDQLWEYGESNTLTLAAFHLELEGNINTGILNPVFRFYYVDGKKPIQATAVSFLIDGVRYDLAAATTGKISFGRETAEVISAPLTQDALALIPLLLEGETVSVRLLGDQIFTMDLIESPTTPKRNAIQNASLDAIAADYALLQAAGMDDYALWDLSASLWEATYGFAPVYAASEVKNTLFQESLSDPFGMLLPGNENKVARTAQEALIQHGFLVGSSATTFDEKASAAVARAQKFYGLISTGCMDSQLEQAMLSQSPAVSHPVQTILQNLGEVAQIALNRYWFAKGVSAADGTDMRTVANASHTLLIADGEIKNISKNTMHLFMQLDAKLIFGDGYAYEAVILCEQNNGATLDTMLLPMEQARLVIYAEIPENLANAPADQWRIEWSIGNDTLLEYSLK